MLSIKYDRLNEFLLKTYLGGHISGANQISNVKNKKLKLPMCVLNHLAMKKCKDNPKNLFSTGLIAMFTDELMSIKK